MRDWRPVALNSETLLNEFPENGIPVNGVLMSALAACLRQTLSAAKNPPGVSVMPSGPGRAQLFHQGVQFFLLRLDLLLLRFKRLP